MVGKEKLSRGEAGRESRSKRRDDSKGAKKRTHLVGDSPSLPLRKKTQTTSRVPGIVFPPFETPPVASIHKESNRPA